MKWHDWKNPLAGKQGAGANPGLSGQYWDHPIVPDPHWIIPKTDKAKTLLDCIRELACQFHFTAKP